MRDVRSRGGVLAGLLLLAAACDPRVEVPPIAADDDDDEAPGCELPACGGNPLGEWTAEGGCLVASGAPIVTGACDEILERDQRVSVSGRLSFDSGGGYALAVTLDAEVGWRFPDECIAESDDCADLMTASAVECVREAGECACTLSVHRDIASIGEWQAQGGILTLAGDDGTAEPLGFCVQGETMRIELDTAEGLTVAAEVRR